MKPLVFHSRAWLAGFAAFHPDTDEVQSVPADFTAYSDMLDYMSGWLAAEDEFFADVSVAA
jgi:hypothetical protein